MILPKGISSWFLLTLLVGLCSGALVAERVSATESSYKIGVGDTLTIEVWGESELSGSYQVAASGSIRRGWLPAVKVQGLTTGQAKEALTAVLKKFIREPAVKLEVTEYRSQRVDLIGAVVKPGSYALKDKPDLLTLLLAAGGLSPSSKGEATILRLTRESTPFKSISVDVSSLLNVADMSQNKTLQAGDVVYFPSAYSEQSKEMAMSQAVVVTGAVKQMGAFPYRKGYTALNAIIDAGGFTKFASPNRSKIVRGKGENEKVIKVELGDVVNHGKKEKDIVLKPGDIVVVPESII